jgi:hypothetical protein
MRAFITFLILLSVNFLAAASEFRHVGDFLLKAHFKIVAGKLMPIPTKPIAFRIFTDGVKIRVSAEGNDDAYTTYEIYRSDGIGRQSHDKGAMEVIPGLQAMSTAGHMLRHLRLSRESMTITTFPGVSDQTIVSYAIAAVPTKSASTVQPKKALLKP